MLSLFSYPLDLLFLNFDIGKCTASKRSHLPNENPVNIYR